MTKPVGRPQSAGRAAARAKRRGGLWPDRSVRGVVDSAGKTRTQDYAGGAHPKRNQEERRQHAAAPDVEADREPTCPTEAQAKLAPKLGVPNLA